MEIREEGGGGEEVEGGSVVWALHLLGPALRAPCPEWGSGQPWKKGGCQGRGLGPLRSRPSPGFPL